MFEVEFDDFEFGVIDIVWEIIVFSKVFYVDLISVECLRCKVYRIILNIERKIMYIYWIWIFEYLYW